MILSVPIGNYDAPSQITVTRENWNNSKNKVYPSVFVSSLGKWFLMSDGFQVVVGSFEPEDSYRLHGTLLFRQNDHGSSVLCLIHTNGTVNDFNSSQSSAPFLISIRNIHVTGDGEIVHASILNSDEAVLVSSSGSIGSICFEPQKSLFMGSCNHFSNLHGIICSGGVPETSLIVLLTESGLCGVVDVSNGLLVNLIRPKILSELGLPIFCTPILRNETDNIDILLTFPYSRILNVFTVSKNVSDIDLEMEIPKIYSDSHILCTCASSYVKNYGSYSLIASVWRDLVQFSLWKEANLSVVAVVENEMSIPYISGYWLNDIFVVSRADGMILPLYIKLDKNKIDEIKVIPNRNINLESCCSVPLFSHSNYFLLLVLSNIESLWNGTTGGICVIDSNNQKRCLKLIGKKLNEPDTFFFDIIVFDESIAIISVKRSGECLAIIPSDSGVNTLVLAHEERPDSVTSCLLYKKKENIFITGYKNGSLRIWISGKSKSFLHMTHTGIVDKIIFLPPGNEQLECEFISVCTERGTIAIHHSKTYECTRMIQSPSVPLTGLIWDQRTEYAFAISGSVVNLWHIPTCRLERVFQSSSLTSETFWSQNLLTSSSVVSPVTVDKIMTLGGIHFSLLVDVISLIEILNKFHTSELQPIYRLALSILFSGSKYLDFQIPELLNLRDGILSKNTFEIRPVSGWQSATYLLAFLLITKILKNSTESVYPMRTNEIKSLGDSLLISGYIEKIPQPKNFIIQAIPLILRLPEESNKQIIRVLIRGAAEQLIPTEILDLLNTLLLMSSEESSLRYWFGISTKISDVDLWCYGFFARIVFLSEISSDNYDNKLEIDFINSSVQKLSIESSRVSEILNILEEKSYVSLMLQTIREYYYYLANKIFCDTTPIVDAVANLAFEGSKNYSNLALKTLVSIAAFEKNKFIESRIDKWYKEKRKWRSRLIAFFGNMIESMPVQSYSCFSTMTEFLLRALDPHNPNKEERNSCVVPVTNVIRLAVNCLPNVSFQQHLQYLAFGNSDGVVQVVNMKTTGIVASFVSHPEAILCVSYSSNTSSHDIAVLSEKMETVKIWRANRSASVLSAILAGPLIEFRLRFTVDIPAFDKYLSKDSERLLLITKCRLRWLSPHCVEFTSPWHNRIQLAIQ